MTSYLLLYSCLLGWNEGHSSLTSISYTGNIGKLLRCHLNSPFQVSTHASIHQWNICPDSHHSQNLIALVSGTLGKKLLTRRGCLQQEEPHWLLGWNLQWLKHSSDAQHRSNCVLKTLWMWFLPPFMPNCGADLPLWNNDPSYCFSSLPNIMWSANVAYSEFFLEIDELEWPQTHSLEILSIYL